MRDLAGRVAVVTGASRESGVGAAICRELAGRGASIFFTHWQPFDAATGFAAGGGPAALEEEIRQLGPVASMPLDLGSEGAAARLLDAAGTALGPPSILVNNAAHWAPSSFRDLTEALLDAHLRVNARGAALLSAEFARRCADLGPGRIISLVSGQDRSGEAGNLAYGLSKGALSAMTRYLAVELAPLGITVNAVDPGPTDTLWMDDATQAAVRERCPGGRLGRPEDAARLVGFLASDASAWITGQVITSDGGFSVV